MKIRTGLLILCSVLVAAGCTSQSRPVVGNMSVAQRSPEEAWQERQRLFADMKQWRLKGRLGLQLREEGWSFGINWLDRGNGRYDISIAHTTGVLMAMVQSTGSRVSLRAADGKVYQDTSAERLLAKHLGLNFPLNHLRYWVRGIPVPGVRVDAIQLDAQGRPSILQQAGWSIKYPTYKGKGVTALPARIDLERAIEQVKARLAAREWQTKF